jgi:TRAP-type C4-dicarboxylate transport system substrate-binding protein
VREAAQRAIAETDALARDAAAIAALGRNGVALVRITPAGHAAFREAAAQVDARWREAVGRELVERAEAIVTQRRTAAPEKR